METAGYQNTYLFGAESLRAIAGGEKDSFSVVEPSMMGVSTQ